MTNPNVERLFDKNIVMDIMTTAIIHYLVEEHCTRVDEERIADFVMDNFEEIVELTVSDENDEE